MDSRPDPIEQIAFLVRSEARIEILRHLSEAGSATQRELRTRLEVSRSTVARSVASLEERGWIERDPDTGAYRLTPSGTLVADDLSNLIDTVRTTDELAAFLEWFPLSASDLDLEQLRDAEITANSPGDPYRPGRAQTEFLRTARRFRGFLPSIDLEGTKVVHEQILNGDLEAEVVVSPDVERTIESAEFAPLFREQLRTGRLTVLVSDVELPFYLGIASDRVQLGVEDDEGFPRALLDSDDESVVDWATGVYREYRETAWTKPVDEF